MAINANLFIHESDKAALEALKAVPGFTQLLKGYMSAVSENMMKIQNLSSCLRISENQLPKYYEMLKDVCKKLDIEVPELYLELNPYPNAYTSGDTKPFIVMTSGLLDTLPERLIPTVLAHECGHIVCHHVLYRTMGQMILNGTIAALGIPGIAIVPIRAAFFYWMRCSEYSADRTAIVYDGSAGNTAEVCVRLSGLDKDLADNVNMDEFLKQAEEYYSLINDNKLNGALNVAMNYANSHPLNAVRAYEAIEWAKSEKYQKVIEYIESGDMVEELPVSVSSNHFAGLELEKAVKELKDAGFENIELKRVYEKSSIFTRENHVLSVKANDDAFKADTWLAKDTKFVVSYYLPLSEEELRQMHPDECLTPVSSKGSIGRDIEEIKEKFIKAGFVNVTVFKREGNNKVADISIGGAPFDRNAWLKKDLEVLIK